MISEGYSTKLLVFRNIDLNDNISKYFEIKSSQLKYITFNSKKQKKSVKSDIDLILNNVFKILDE